MQIVTKTGSQLEKSRPLSVFKPGRMFTATKKGGRYRDVSAEVLKLWLNRPKFSDNFLQMNNGNMGISWWIYHQLWEATRDEAFEVLRTSVGAAVCQGREGSLWVCGGALSRIKNNEFIVALQKIDQFFSWLIYIGFYFSSFYRVLDIWSLMFLGSRASKPWWLGDQTSLNTDGTPPRDSVGHGGLDDLLPAVFDTGAVLTCRLPLWLSRGACPNDNESSEVGLQQSTNKNATISPNSSVGLKMFKFQKQSKGMKMPTPNLCSVYLAFMAIATFYSPCGRCNILMDPRWQNLSGAREMRCFLWRGVSPVSPVSPMPKVCHVARWCGWKSWE